MNIKKILIPISILSLTVPFGMPVMAEEKGSESVKIVTEENIRDTSEEEPFTGYKKEKDVEYYYVKGKKYTGKLTVDGETFYFSKGVKTKKYLKIEGYETEVPLKGNKWINLKGYWHFVKDGMLVKGWKNFTKADGEKIAHCSYFDNTNGRLYTGWHNMSKKEGETTDHYSYFGENGWLRTGWQWMGKGTSNPDGNSPKHISYFGSNGWLRTGWVKLGKGTSEPDGNSVMHLSYFGANGWLRTGWQQMGTKTNPDGKSKVHWSYFGGNGWLQTGWKYFTAADGEKKNHWSYFGGNGWLATGYAKVNNVNCTFSGTGWLNKTEMDLYQYVDQNKDGYYQGCAGASLLMALKMKGKLRNLSYVDFMNTMPRSTDGTPLTGFRGNPKAKEGYMNAIYPPAIAKWGKRYGNVSDISGCNVNRLKDETRLGNIPVVLVYYKFDKNPRFGQNPKLDPQNWGFYKYYMNAHHFNTLLGYDYVNNRYKVADPNTRIAGQGDTMWIDGKVFERYWNIQKGAVLVK